jgi:hypothetical protein
MALDGVTDGACTGGDCCAACAAVAACTACATVWGVPTESWHRVSHHKLCLRSMKSYHLEGCRDAWQGVIYAKQR